MASTTDQCAGSGFDPHPDHSLLQLLKDLRDESTLLLRQEIALAKTEIGEKISRVTRNCAYLAAGALIAFVGAITLAIAAVAGVFLILQEFNISAAISLWLAPLAVAIVLASIGGVLIL